MPKFTPGPWEVKKLNGPLDDWTETQYAIFAKGAPGGVVLVMGGLGADEEHGNAQLVAAAPKLYEALKKAVKQLEAMGGDGSASGADAALAEVEQ